MALGRLSQSMLTSSSTVELGMLLAHPHCAAQPPSTFQATPRTLAPAGEQKNTASSPSSSGVVNCSDGSFSASNWFLAASLEMPWAAALASTCFCTSGVSTQPGQMALQVTPEVAF